MILVVVATLAIMGYIVVGSMTRVQTQCEVCVEFGGARRCAKAAGANEAEAKQAAQTTACGPLVSGMDESIRCQNTPPKSSTCSTS